MNFNAWIQDLYRRRRAVSAARAGTLFEEACALFGHPQKAFKAIHVGGTNGKGSVAYGTYEQLRRSGCCTGLFTSPHLSCPTERIAIDGVRISAERLRAIGSEILHKCNHLHFFAWITLAALIYFREEGVQWGVFEVGLGGRYDPTRVVLSEVAVITSIGLDHADILGSTLEEIAANKRAILRPGARHILGPTASPWIDAPTAQHIPAGSNYIEENAALVRAVLRSIGYAPLEPIARPPGRFERCGDGIVIDVAHNPPAFEALASLLEGKDWEVLIALAKDKDIAGCMAPLLGKVRCFHLVCFEEDRAHSPGDLMRAVQEADAVCYDSIERALEGWLAAGGKRLACGSFYLIGPAMELLDKKGLRTSRRIPQPV